jgi:iron complex outermembrane recepter protein
VFGFGIVPPEMPKARTGSNGSGRSLRAAVAVVLMMVVAGLVTAGTARAADAPLAGWQQRLSRAETALKKLTAADGAGRGRVARDLAALRGEVAEWLPTFAPAKEGAQAWLSAAGPAETLEDLAAEVGRLRAALSRIAGAQEGGDTGVFYLGRMDVAVTAAVTASATTEMTPAGASVLDARDLQSGDKATLAGALALAPGVSFTRIGQRNETAVYVRGFDMRQVPLFVDGVPVYTPYDGYVDLERFTTFDVAELRVSKGFSSVLAGPNALGGTINIVSRRPAAKLEGLAGVTYGSGSAASVYVNAGTRVNHFYVQGGASYLDADTFPLPSDFVATKNQATGDRVNAYKTDKKFNVKLGWTPSGSGEYAVSYVGQRGKKGNPPYAGTDTAVKVRYWQWPYWDKDSVYFVSNTMLGGSHYLRGRAYYDTYDNALSSYDDATFTTQVKSSAFKSLYHDYTTGGSAEWRATLGRHTLRAAGHAKFDYHDDHNVGDPVKEFDGRILSVGAEDTVVLGPKASLVGGVSGDWQATTKASDYQNKQVIDLLQPCKTNGTGCGDSKGFNPQIGVFYSTSAGLLRATVARKTRMPSLKDRYSYKMGTAIPNPDLKSEHNLTYEAGYQGALGTKTSFQASVFYSRIDDMIQKFYVAANLSQLRNIGRASNAGVELDARTQLVPHLDLGANYTFLDRKNISDPATPLVDAPRHKGRVSATLTVIPTVRLVAGIDFDAGRRTQNEAGTYKDVPSFAVVNVKGTWTIHHKLDVELSVLNASDKYYWVGDGYPEAGRTVMGGLRYRF